MDKLTEIIPESALENHRLAPTSRWAVGIRALIQVFLILLLAIVVWYSASFVGKFLEGRHIAGRDQEPDFWRAVSWVFHLLALVASIRLVIQQGRGGIWLPFLLTLAGGIIYNAFPMGKGREGEWALTVLGFIISLSILVQRDERK